MSNRRKSEGFQVGDVVVATSEAQDLEFGIRYLVLKREGDPGTGRVRYTLKRLHAQPPLEVVNLPNIAALAEEEVP